MQTVRNFSLIILFALVVGFAQPQHVSAFGNCSFATDVYNINQSGNDFTGQLDGCISCGTAHGILVDWCEQIPINQDFPDWWLWDCALTSFDCEDVYPTGTSPDPVSGTCHCYYFPGGR